VKLTAADLQFLVDDARRRFIEMPALVLISGNRRLLTEGERMAICFFTASATVWRRHGFISEEMIDDVDPELERPSSETMTDGAE